MTSDVKDLVEHLRAEAAEMHEAPSGGDTLHADNWSDKPHRVLYDAVRIIREAADEIERLKCEVEVHHFNSEANYRKWNEAYQRAEAAERERDALNAENERLREALHPFAAEAGEWGDAVPDSHHPVFLEPGHWDARYYGSAAKFTVGDQRGARAALHPTQGGE